MINPSLMALMQIVKPPAPKLTLPRTPMTPRGGTTRADGRTAPLSTMPMNRGGFGFRPLTSAQNRQIGKADAMTANPLPSLGEPELQKLPTPPSLYDPTMRPTLNVNSLVGMLSGVTPSNPVNLTAPSDMEQWHTAQQAGLPHSAMRFKAEENKAKLANLQKQISAMQPPSAPTPYTPPPVPVRQELPLPEHPHLQPPAAANIMAALAGLIAPQNAGNFAAVPYHVAGQEEDRQYAEALKRVAYGQQQADTEFGDAMNARHAQIQTDLMNRADAEQQAALLREYQLRRGGAEGEIAQLETVQKSLPELIAEDEETQRNALHANQIGTGIQTKLAGNQEALQRYAAQVNGTALQNKAILDNRSDLAKLLQDAKDKEAQRRTTERGQDLQFNVGAGRNAVSLYGAQTGRQNVDMRQKEFDFRQKVDALNRLGKMPTEAEYIGDAPDVKYWADLSKQLLGTLARKGILPTPTDRDNLQHYEKMRLDAAARASADYRTKYAAPALPAPKKTLIFNPLTGTFTQGK